MTKRTDIKQIHTYADRHLRDWFPKLPGYTAFVQRLNRVADVFVPLLTLIQNEQQGKNDNQPWLIDSFPVALAKQGHRFKACVAKEIADSGYCSTKNLYFYGVRVHIVARENRGTLPTPEYIGVTGATIMMEKSLTKFVLFYTTTIFMVIKPICVQMRNKS